MSVTSHMQAESVAHKSPVIHREVGAETQRVTAIGLSASRLAQDCLYILKLCMCSDKEFRQLLVSGSMRSKGMGVQNGLQFRIPRILGRPLVVAQLAQDLHRGRYPREWRLRRR